MRGVKIYGDVWIGDDVYLDEDHPESVEIHNGAAIATRCTIIAHTKGAGKIIIEELAAIGAGSLIVCSSGKSLTIGKGAVVSAGSTILHDIPAHTLCGPPRTQAFGTVTVPFGVATTFEEFIRGLEPLRKKNGNSKVRVKSN
jgi:acetyltransferase-like isoleucine patch superfamily enzyme